MGKLKIYINTQEDLKINIHYIHPYIYILRYMYTFVCESCTISRDQAVIVQYDKTIQIQKQNILLT